MYLGSNGMLPSKQWYHKPEMINNNKWTVAM